MSACTLMLKCKPKGKIRLKRDNGLFNGFMVETSTWEWLNGESSSCGSYCHMYECMVSLPSLPASE